VLEKGRIKHNIELPILSLQLYKSLINLLPRNRGVIDFGWLFGYFFPQKSNVEVFEKKKVISSNRYQSSMLSNRLRNRKSWILQLQIENNSTQKTYCLF
jgi:hypothetical protein